MKNLNYFFLFALLSLFLFSSCDNEDNEPAALKLTFANISLNIDENPANGQEIGSASAVVNRGDITYTLSNQNPVGAMVIDAQTGKLTVADASLFDFEANPTITATGTATVEGVSKSATITVTVNDVDEASPTVIIFNSYTLNIDENPSSGAFLGLPGAETNQGTLTFSIVSQTPAGATAIDTNTGELTVANASLFDFEVNPTVTVEVKASANGVTETATATILVNDKKDSGSPFVTTWKTTSANEWIVIYTNTDYTYDYTIDWGNGVKWSGMRGNAEYRYPTAGEHEVKIYGDFPAIKNLTNSTNAKKILHVSAWGDMKWETMAGAFQYCENLTITATDVPDLSRVTNMDYMFGLADNFDGNLNGWDVSNVTLMEGVFANCRVFNRDLNSWDVSNVTSMRQMFSGATAFNGNISNWNVGKVINMSQMFRTAEAFNQDIGDWDVRNVTDMGNLFFNNLAFNQDLNDWKVDNVTNMAGMFTGARNFNGNISNWNVSKVIYMSSMFFFATKFDQDISNWNVSSATNMSSMFYNAYDFNQDISNWNVTNVTDMSSMFRNARRFNQDLTGWATGNVTSCTDFRKDSGLSNANKPTAGSCGF